MPLSAEQQFMIRAKKALEEGNTSFTARGTNKIMWEKLKQEFEDQQATEPPTKRANTSSSSSCYSSSLGDAEDVISEPSQNSHCDTDAEPSEASTTANPPAHSKAEEDEYSYSSSEEEDKDELKCKMVKIFES